MARIIVSQHHPVGKLLGQPAHLRALAPVAIPATAEHATHAAVRMLAHRTQHLLQGIGRVRIIHDHQWHAGFPAKTFHPAGYGLDRAETGLRRIQAHTAGQQRCQCRQQVGGVEPPQKRATDPDRPLRRHRLHFQSVGQQPDRPCMHIAAFNAKANSLDTSGETPQ